jgi:HAD superfamily hydrolase (TIGR01509 family)
MPSSLPYGAIFDWDGVIINSGEHHLESWHRLAFEIRQTFTREQFQTSFGMKNDQIIPNLLGWTKDPAEIQRFSLRKEELYRDVVKERGLQALPGVRDWLEVLRQHEVPCVIGTSTHRANVLLALDLLDLNGYFADITSAEDVNLGKPHPEVFLACAMKIQRNPALCVVFEDAHVGLEAAHAGGMRCVALTTTHPAETLQDANLLIKDLSEMTWQKLEGLFR